jgi:hypothetical protein
LRGAVENGRGFVSERFARGGLPQLGDGPDIARVDLGNFAELFALHHLNVLEAFRRAAVVVDQRRVIF